MSTVKKDHPSGKDTRKAIEQQFETLLSNWKEQLGEKKFRNRVKKAAKVFSKGLPLVKKEAPVNKKAAKKNVAGKKAADKKAAAGKKAAAAKPAQEQ